MSVNEQSGRLFTGIEVGQNMAVVEVVNNTWANVPLPELYGAAVAVEVRHSSDHAFLADQEYVVIVDGATRASLKLPLDNEPQGGILVQDVAVNQSTGWAYGIPDDDWPFVVAVQDPVIWSVPSLTYLPMVLRAHP